jgi:aspartate/tyrosine/aromatic aminotransferase
MYGLLQWPNHGAIMRNSGLEPVTYRYYDKKKNALDMDGMLADIEAADTQSAFLFHPCAHNPTGKFKPDINCLWVILDVNDRL